MSTARSIVSEAAVLAVGVAAAALLLRSETRLYEATRTLELTGAVLSAEESQLHAGPEIEGSAVRMVERLASQLAERDRQRCSIKIVGVRRLSLGCRADTAATAQQHCDRLGRETIAMVNALRMLPASAPLLVGHSLDSRLRALALGGAAGLFWILLRLAWLRRTPAARNPPAGQVVPPASSQARDPVQIREAVASVAPAKPEVSAPQRAVIVTPAPEFVATDRSAQRTAPTGSPSTLLALSASNAGPASSVVEGASTTPSAANRQASEREPAAQLNSNGGVRSTRPARRLELNRTVQGAGPHAGNVLPMQGEDVIDGPVEAADPHQANRANVFVETSANLPREASRAANPGSTVLAQEAESRWAPHREVVAAAPLAELTKLSEELFRLATRGGVLVRVASGPECERIKSEVAAQLAWMLAERGSARVLLLEADFERPAVQRVMKVETPPFKGFSQQLHQRATSGTRAAWSVLRCAPSLNVLAEGRVRTLGLLDSPEFSVALAELRRYYDIIIADGPVIDSGVDSRALDGVADSIVYVTTSGAAVSATIELITRTYGDKELVWVVRTAAAPEG